MGETTGISWTDHTFNPWWGCWKIDPECKNCYADTTANRHAPGLWGRTAPRRFFGDKHWNEPRKWNRNAERDGVRRRVFVGSMCDWAERHADPATAALLDAARAELFALIEECTALDWLLLTKRPEDAAELLPWVRWPKDPAFANDAETCAKLAQPWPHVWIGVTAGCTETVDRKVPILRCIPAAIRFISCEPILDHISADTWDRALSPIGSGPIGEIRTDGGITRPHTGIDWLIVGDESGPNKRPAQVDWLRTAREAALRNGVAYHLKQWNGPTSPSIGGNADKGRKIHLPILDGRQWAQFPITSK